MVLADLAHPSRTCGEASRRIRVLTRTAALGIVCLLLTIGGESCSRRDQPTNAITITLIDQGWSSSDYHRRLNEVAEFTRQTGVRVEFLPAPETAAEQLATVRKLLESGAKVPDGYVIDVIWPGILADHLLDLRDYIPGQQIAAYLPDLIANNTVNGRLVALPSFLNEGVLFYRTDLLRKYRYRAPPATWHELEVMARQIQAGERAKGNKDFWGYVWQGAASEALTCDALEWQVSEGGGAILDEKGKVAVNNAQNIRAWERAARWVGSISPPGVVAHKEWDAQNIQIASARGLAHEPPNLDRARASATRIDKYGNRAAEIIDRIRSLYKKSPTQRVLVDVNGIIEELLALLKCEADRYSIAMRTELTGELPKIVADRVQLQQVFMNLMLNAVEAMKDSGGELTIRSQREDSRLQFSVSDTGVGLPPEKLDQIFSAFFTTKPQGSGMGLAISRSIVESHGGRLWATVNDGRGATFHFTLPIQVTEPSPLVA
jgi:signal transduction histidine kinase